MINGKTRLLCLLGSPVEHSFSPAMHNASFQKLNINAKYMAFDVKAESLKQAVEGLRNLGFMGANVTIPHKVNVMQYLDELDPKAARIGAVNTIVHKDNKLYGTNTDVDGFIESFKRFQFEFKNKKVAVLGTGGASKAVVVGFLYENVAEIHVYSRTLQNSKSLADALNDPRIIPKTYEELEKDYPYDVIVNTTPLGMYPNENNSIINSKEFGYKDTMFYDLIYNPIETEFLKQARLSGRKTINGLDMLIYQGLFALKHWFEFDESMWTREDVIEILKASNII